MGTFRSLEEAQAFFIQDRFAAVNGMGIDELYDGGCECSMELGETHRNAHGRVMGGVIYTLADFAFAVASNNDHGPATGLDASIQYLRSSKGTRLIAKASCVKGGKSIVVYQVKVTDDLGQDIALFTGTGFRLQAP